MKQTEVWRDVPGFIGVCQASCLGRVRTLRRNGSWLVRSPDTANYPGVSINVKGIKHRRNVHVLVLLAFKGLPPPGHEGAHLDGNRANNRVSNLAWKTHAENCQDRVTHGTQHRGSTIHNARLTADDAVAIRASSDSVAELAEQYDVSINSIHNILKRKTWKHV